MGAQAFLDRLISGIDTALHRRERRSDEFHQLPDRRLLREVYLPAFAEAGGRILWVGCRRYTSGYYALLESHGAEVWTTDIEPKLKRWGRTGRHRIGDICLADQLFADLSFDAVVCNGILGYGVDSLAQQQQAIAAMARILKPGGRLLVGWNTDKIDDTVAAGLFTPLFTEAPFAGHPSRVRFDEVTHVYDSFTRNG